MKFRLELDIKPFSTQLDIEDHLLLTGSCFTDHIGRKLSGAKFSVLENPNGIVFNPVSIYQCIETWIANRKYTANDLFYYNELWTSWDFHGRFSHPDVDACLSEMNAAVENAHHFLKKANWVIITLGSAFVYTLNGNELGTQNMVVANCHKVPANKFEHRLLSFDETKETLQKTVRILRAFNPQLNVMFTVSPVRHYREGLVENNLSKGVLLNAVAAALQEYSQVYYFPSYELVIDDLRDYRFYAEDLVHPNYAATEYVWQKFLEACINEPSRSIISKLNDIRIAFQHKPHHAGSVQHQKFLHSYYEKTMQLQQEFPFLNLSDELDYFKGK